MASQARTGGVCGPRHKRPYASGRACPLGCRLNFGASKHTRFRMRDTRRAGPVHCIQSWALPADVAHCIHPDRQRARKKGTDRSSATCACILRPVRPMPERVLIVPLRRPQASALHPSFASGLRLSGRALLSKQRHSHRQPARPCEARHHSIRGRAVRDYRGGVARSPRNHGLNGRLNPAIATALQSWPQHF